MLLRLAMGQEMEERHREAVGEVVSVAEMPLGLPWPPSPPAELLQLAVGQLLWLSVPELVVLGVKVSLLLKLRLVVGLALRQALSVPQPLPLAALGLKGGAEL